MVHDWCVSPLMWPFGQSNHYQLSYLPLPSTPELMPPKQVGLTGPVIPPWKLSTATAPSYNTAQPWKPQLCIVPVLYSACPPSVTMKIKNAELSSKQLANSLQRLKRVIKYSELFLIVINLFVQKQAILKVSILLGWQPDINLEITVYHPRIGD